MFWALSVLLIPLLFVFFSWKLFFAGHHTINVWIESNIWLHQCGEMCVCACVPVCMCVCVCVPVRRKGNICLLIYGLSDLFPLQMGCHALWFHKANATVTNDSGCDPVTATFFTRTNKRARWRSVLQLQRRSVPPVLFSLMEGTVKCQNLKHSLRLQSTKAQSHHWQAVSACSTS